MDRWETVHELSMSIPEYKALRKKYPGLSDEDIAKKVLNAEKHE